MSRNKDSKAADAGAASSSSRTEIIKGLNEDPGEGIQGDHTVCGLQFRTERRPVQRHRGAAEEARLAGARARPGGGRQIDYLGGVPTVKGKQAEFSSDSKKMLEIDLKDEQTTIKSYREKIRQAERAGEFALSEALRDIIAEEQDHEIDPEGRPRTAMTREESRSPASFFIG
jgi:bacterioferritin